jgi:hypothetical protein
MTVSPSANPGPSPIDTPQPGEQFFRQSIADLSKRLGERAARQSTSEPQTAAEARRRAMQAYERERARKLRLILTGAAAFVVTAGIAWAVVMLGQPDAPAPALARPVASAQPESQVVMASAPPVQAPPPVTSEAPRAEEPPPPPPAVEAQPSAPPPPQQTPAASEPPPAPTPAAPPLNRAEIREVQKRLLAFGFDPGPIDGVSGRQTEIATQHYLEARGQPQMPPTEPQLLENLRQDQTAPAAPPPQVAQRATQSDGNGVQAAPQRSRPFDPFQPVKLAGAEITRWLQSAFR